MAEGKVVPVVSACAFDKDQKLCALSPNNEDVHIYETKGLDDCSKWDKKYTLKEHGGFVACIDWHSETNKIVTCGHDRNAYVWSLDAKTDLWKPTLVVLRINRAATAVKWSPAGTKFAVASGAKCVPVCHYEQKNDWYISKMIKKHKSTVLSLAWCVNNKFLVTSGCDNKVRIFSAYIEGIDPAEDDGFGEIWPKQHEFGEILLELDVAQSWVNSVSWSPGGFRLAFAEHGSRMHFVQILAGSAPIIRSVNHKGLPFNQVQFLTNDSVLAAGYDMNGAIFSVNGGSDADPTWGFQEFFEKPGAKPAAAAASAAAPKPGAVGGNAFGAARAMFAGAVDRGQSLPGSSATANAKNAENKSSTSAPAIQTKHTNAIVSVWPVTDANGAVTKIWTAGLDGRVCQWDVAKLGLKIK